MTRRVVAALLFLAITIAPAFADDAAASIGAGGLVVLKREDRITMAREILTINLRKVRVDYEFRNDTDQDVTTVVAFPIPPYALEAEERSIKEQGFDDFRLTIEGRAVHFQVEARAKLKNHDVTSTLSKDGIDVATFGHYDDLHGQARDIRRLSLVQRNSLIRAGLVDSDANSDYANWTVEKKYYWTQTFPANATVHIPHEYTPVVGYNYVSTGEFRAVKQGASVPAKDPQIDKFTIAELKSVCLDEGLRSNLEAASAHGEEGYGHIMYVDFILTSANTWKQPIVDFTLFVERQAEIDQRNVVSFCWPNPVEKVDRDRFKATAANLVPQHELRVGFFQLNK
jgi:hypothetical protein